jgi:heat shock protein HslJ
LTRAGGALGALAALALILSACAGTGGSSGESPVGQWNESSEEGSPELSLFEGGDVAGYDGCNQMDGTWEATDDGVEFGEFAATMMACEDVDDWLSGAASATISGDTMTVLDADGESIGTLEKTSDEPDDE